MGRLACNTTGGQAEYSLGLTAKTRPASSSAAVAANNGSKHTIQGWNSASMCPVGAAQYYQRNFDFFYARVEKVAVYKSRATGIPLKARLCCSAASLRKSYIHGTRTVVYTSHLNGVTRLIRYQQGSWRAELPLRSNGGRLKQ